MGKNTAVPTQEIVFYVSTFYLLIYRKKKNRKLRTFSRIYN